MKNQPYIFKKQIITSEILLLFIIICLYFEVPYKILTFLIVYEVIVIGAMFIPSLPRHIKYPKWIHTIIYEIPFIITAFFYIPINNHKTIDYVVVGIISLVATSILLLIARKEYLKNITSITINMPISIKIFMIEVLRMIFQIFFEEVCFRRFFIGWIKQEYGIITILISSLLFTYTHFLNRWANVKFNKFIYGEQFILGLILGSAYYVSDSLLICIICHLVFNSSVLLNLVIRLTRTLGSYRKRENIFDDYN